MTITTYRRADLATSTVSYIMQSNASNARSAWTKEPKVRWRCKTKESRQDPISSSAAEGFVRAQTDPPQITQSPFPAGKDGWQQDSIRDPKQPFKCKQACSGAAALQTEGCHRMSVCFKAPTFPCARNLPEIREEDTQSTLRKCYTNLDTALSPPIISRKNK